ncbi:MAG TPA: SCO family protein [Pyrinomonadaceae bacterium]|nr:SCO family protein [Pyrinomonadaceae bacterium]
MQSINRSEISGPALRFFLILLICASAIGLACRPRRSANEKRYDLKGKVVAVNKSERTATIAHEDIKGYMPAMTMPFKIKSDADLEMLKPGDQVTGTLVVDDISSWVEIAAIVEGPGTVSQTVDVPGEPKPGTDVPDFGLVNQDGKRIHLAQYRGQALALTFIYTRCPMPDQCTLMSNNFAAIDQELQKQPDVYAKTHLLTISFDPEYDSPKVLRSYGASHTGRYSDETFQHWEFATGGPDEVKGIAQFFGLRYFHDTESAQDQVIHSLRTVVIGPDGKLFKLYRGNEWKPAEVVSDLINAQQTIVPQNTPKVDRAAPSK